MQTVRNHSVYYKLDAKSVDYFKKNRYEAKHFCRYLDIENFV